MNMNKLKINTIKIYDDQKYKERIKRKCSKEMYKWNCGRTNGSGKNEIFGCKQIVNFTWKIIVIIC